MRFRLLAWLLPMLWTLPMNSSLARDAIEIRDRHFVYAGTENPFSPVGINYSIVRRIGGTKEHIELAPGYYRAELVESLMEQAQSWGLTVVRTFLPGPAGMTTPDHALDAGFTRNLLDFLSRARSRQLRVILVPTWMPNPALSAAPWMDTRDLELSSPDGHPLDLSGMGENRKFFDPAKLLARAAVFTALIRAIRNYDPDLLRTVFSWEIDNESGFYVDKSPFADGRTVVLGKTSYDLMSQPGIDAFENRVVVTWLNKFVSAIHREDPDALVSDSVYSRGVVDRDLRKSPGVREFIRRRRPFTLLAEARSNLSFLDLHSYVDTMNETTSSAATLSADLESERWQELSADLAVTGKPIIAGETGVHRSDMAGANQPPDIGRGIELLRTHVTALRNIGFAGILLWYFGDPESDSGEPYLNVRDHPRFLDPIRSLFLSVHPGSK